MKETICTAVGALGGLIASFFGGWGMSIIVLVIFMAIDYVTGLIVAGVFKASPKTENGALESGAALKGLLRKGAMMTVLLVATGLDNVLGFNYITSATALAFIASETISILENVGHMGVNYPDSLKNAIEILQNKSKEEK